MAIERYRYMLRTAPPETVEQAHAEAFAKLTPEQRREVLNNVGNSVPASERATSDDPQSLARMATRAEMREPGMLERTLGRGGGVPGRAGGGMGMGGMIAGGLLAGVAGAFVGTAVAQAFLPDDIGDPAGETGEGDLAADDAGGMDPGGMDDLGGMDDMGI
ncbi:MAG: hypothetical protein ACRDRA_14555 [Pseudonocardiaceae bacterium]